MIKNILSRSFSFLLIFVPSLFILCAYSAEAQRLGLMEPLERQSADGLTLLFTSLATIPLVVIWLWPLFATPDILIPAWRYRGVKWWVVVTRWRAAFAVSIICIFLLKGLL